MRIFPVCLALAALLAILPASPCFPAGAGPGTLVFSALNHGNWDLFMARPDGSGVKQLTDDPFDERDPAFSRDGKKIAYSNSAGELFILNLATGQSERVPFEDPDRTRNQPVLSPDGGTLAYVETTPDATDHTVLRLKDLSTGGDRPALVQKMNQFWPAFSPSGGEMVFCGTHCAVSCGRILQEPWMLKTSGGFARQLVQTDSHCREPAFSPDGRLLAFASDREGDMDIWLMDLSDRSLVRLTGTGSTDLSPAFSPDGGRLAFVSNREGGALSVWILDLDSRKMVRVPLFGNPGTPVKDVDWR